MTVVALVVFEAICVVKSYIFLQAPIFIICILQVHCVHQKPLTCSIWEAQVFSQGSSSAHATVVVARVFEESHFRNFAA